jgi:hypothetical protein
MSGMTAALPWRNDVKPDVSSGFGKIRGQPVPNHERTEVMLTSRISEQRRRYLPAHANTTSLFYEGVKVFGARSEPSSRIAACYAVLTLLSK